jgi:hypothetical protein
MIGPNLAPEIYNDNWYDQKVDTWNLGAVLYMLLCGTSHYPQLESVTDVKTIG